MFLISKDYWQVRKTKKKGKRVFAKKEIAEGTIIGDYVGKIIQLEDVDFEEEKKKMFLMYYDDSTGIYPDLRKPGVHLTNHSCFPNCWIYNYKNHTLFFTLRNINKGEELTINYLLPPKTQCEPCTHRCYCGSKNCTGSMHLSEAKYKKWQEFQDKEFRNTGIRGTKGENKLKLLKNYPETI